MENYREEYFYNHYSFNRKYQRLFRNGLLAAGTVEPFYVLAYEVTRHYGGPEEGGWWYDLTRHLEVKKAYTWQTGLMFAKTLKEEYPTCPRGRHSVIGGADTYVHVFRTEDDFPEENSRPRYE